MIILETKRLKLRLFEDRDDAFMLRLVNEPSWWEHIGDKGIRSLDDSRKYIEEGLIGMYQRQGFGLYLVEMKHGGKPIGMCGLLKRDSLEDADLGFAFCEEFWGKGFAYESADATLSYAEKVLLLSRVVAITSPANESSMKLLEKLGFCYEQMLELSSFSEKIMLYGIELSGRLPRSPDTSVQ